MFIEKRKILIVLEYGDNDYWAWTESSGKFLLTTYGETREEVTANIIDSLNDWIAHEGQDYPDWKHQKAEDFEFQYQDYVAELLPSSADCLISRCVKRSLNAFFSLELNSRLKNGIHTDFNSFRGKYSAERENKIIIVQ